MISADDFINPAEERGYSFYTGVPCSFLSPFINRAITSPKTSYVGATSEGEAVAIAAGAWLAGRKTVVMCQNSGLGNCVNPLTSLNYPFRIPTLLITTWRGQPGVKDEPQHELMSRMTQSLLETMRVRCMTFPRSPGEIEGSLNAAEAVMDEERLPYGMVMEKGIVADESLDDKPAPASPESVYTTDDAGNPTNSRLAALEKILENVPENAAIIATTGKSGRELFTLSDRPQHLYQVGSMGCASGMGLGVALNTDKPVVVLDGDGAALMKMGSLATIGAQSPKKLIHIILDNGVHDSTGGQATVSRHVDFAKVAAACHYRNTWQCSALDTFTEYLKNALTSDGPHLIHMRILPGSMDNLGRPTISPEDVAIRFKEFLASAG